jgi:hypothetical protein
MAANPLAKLNKKSVNNCYLDMLRNAFRDEIQLRLKVLISLISTEAAQFAK